MNIDDFQQHALKSIAITERGPAALAHRTLGLTGEAGIVGNQIKKIIRDKGSLPDPDDIEEIKRRLGDVMYYTAALADYFSMSLSEIATANMERSSDFADNHNIK
jgi:NTP pyrophosphatase (non-canonical NTP hydrolase)